jgi:hypothetical protein
MKYFKKKSSTKIGLTNDIIRQIASTYDITISTIPSAGMERVDVELEEKN